jgi:transcriptional regulator with XRE-family HTH domain
MSKAQEELSTFPRQLRAEREQRGWSQARVAELLVTDIKTVSRWERGIVTPAPYLREKLCELFGKTPQAFGLFDHEELMPPPGVASPGFLRDPHLPVAPAYPLIGREKELALLRHRLRQGGNLAVAALNGLPGVGKTAISLALAHDPELRASFKDGVLWAGLGPDPDILGHVNRWAMLLEVPPDELVDLTDLNARLFALRRAIDSRTMLLIIDDVWRTEDALALKIGGPTCAHLMTTRFPSIASQLASERAIMLEELTTEEGIELLRTLAPDAVEQEYEGVRELVESVGGLPLALILVGNYLHMQSYKSRPQRIAETLHLLRDATIRFSLTELRSPSERHSSRSEAALVSLHSVITVTDKQLDERTRQALYVLSVFPPKPNSFSEEAALVVADCSIATLDLLINASLLQVKGARRYLLHPTITDYACLQLEESGYFDTAYKRLIAYFTAFVEQHSLDYELLERERRNILVALEAAFTLDGVRELPRLACAFTPFLLARGQFALAQCHLQRASETASLAGDVAGQMRALVLLEHIRQIQGTCHDRLEVKP